MQIYKAYRYELDPNVQQRIHLAKHAGAARFAYNWGLARRIALWEESKKGTTSINQHKELCALKKTEYPWLYEVSKYAPQCALQDLDYAFQRFWKGRRGGAKVGFPRFKKKGRHDSFRLYESIYIRGSHVQLPRLGRIRLKEEPNVVGRILYATVRRDVDKWFVSLTCEVEVPDPVPVVGEVIGIDVGLSALATHSGGEKVHGPNPYKQNLRRVKRLSRWASRKQDASKNKKKAKVGLAKLHRHVRNKRQDFLHKYTTTLAKTKSVIVLENLNVPAMMRMHSIAVGIGDAGFAEIREMLKYKTTWYGSRLILADRWFPSSKQCSACGHILKKLSRNTREWTCPECGTHHDRDINAAKNLVALAQ